MSELKPPEMDNQRIDSTREDAPATQCRMRIYFRKGNECKYISHLDMLRAWERAIRRSGLPLAYSQGFSPHPKITIAMPLAVGCTGENEALDVILETPTPEKDVIAALGPVMPPGLSVTSAETVPLKSPALATLFSQAIYDVYLAGVDRNEVERRITDLMQRETVLVEFRRKQIELRPLVGSLTLNETAPDPTSIRHRADCIGRMDCIRPMDCIRAVLLRDDRGRIGRPDVLLEALRLSEYVQQIHRIQVVYQTPD